MTSRDFCYWLQGYFEVRDASKPGPEMLTAEQVAMIKAHLAMVFVHEIDPSFPKEQQAALDAAHVGKVVKLADSTTVPPHSHGYVEPPVFRC